MHDRRSFFIGCLGLLVTSLAPASVDLTPRPSYYEIEGRRFPCVAFHDGNRRISYTPPPGWQLSGGGTRLTLCPRETAQADAHIEILPALPSAGGARGATAPVLSPDVALKLAGAALPTGAEKVEHLGSTPNPLRIDGNGTLEIALRFQQGGLTYRTAVLLLSRGTELWRFSVTARNQDFPRVDEAFRASLYSLQGLP